MDLEMCNECLDYERLNEYGRCPVCEIAHGVNDPSKQMVDMSKLTQNKISKGAKFRVGRKLLFDDTGIFIIAMVDSTRETLYNLIDINTGERWFAFALDQHRFILALQKLENDYGFKFID